MPKPKSSKWGKKASNTDVKKQTPFVRFNLSLLLKLLIFFGEKDFYYWNAN